MAPLGTSPRHWPALWTWKACWQIFCIHILVESVPLDHGARLFQVARNNSPHIQTASSSKLIGCKFPTTSKACWLIELYETMGLVLNFDFMRINTKSFEFS